VVTITTRAGKGSPLTHNEVDANFTNLNTGLTWQQIASSTPTGTGTVTFSSVPATYADLMVVFEGVSTATSGDVFYIEGSGDNGSTWFLVATSSTAGAGETLYGGFLIPGYLLNAGSTPQMGTANLTSDQTSTDPADASDASWRCAGGMDAIRVRTGANNFDAGTIRLMGK
jgi:hypothetical protein